LGVPEATVRYRIRRLKDQGRMATVTMPALSEGALRASFFVRTVPGKTDELIEELKGIESLVYLAIGSGTYDVFCHGVFRDEDEFLQFRNRTLGGSPTVAAMESMQIVKLVSRNYAWWGSPVTPA
jgi:DNA-binding Lrp family transcriptional regulator